MVKKNVENTTGDLQRRLEDEGERDAKQMEDGKQRPTRPDRNKLIEQLGNLDKRFKELQAKRNEIQEQIKKIKESNDKVYEERGAIINKLKGYRAEFQAAKREREALEKQVEKLEGDKKQKLELERQTRMALEYKSIEEVDRRIKNVEHIIETESLDSKEERELLKQVQRLKASRKAVEDYEKLRFSLFGPRKEKKEKSEEKGGEGAGAGAGAGDKKQSPLQAAHTDARGNLMAQLRQKKAKQKEIMELIKSEEEVLDQLKSKKDDTIRALIKEKNDIKDQIDGIFKEKRQLREDFDKQRAAWDEFHAELKKAREEKRAAEIEARKAEEEQRRLQKEEEQLQQHPYATEIATCDNLVNYLERLRPKTDEGEVKEEPSGADHQVIDGKQGVVLQQAEESFAVGGGRKAKGRKNRKTKTKKPADLTLKHPMDALFQFSTIEITAPTGFAAIDSTIDAIKEKKKYFQTDGPRIKEWEERRAELARRQQEVPKVEKEEAEGAEAGGDNVEENDQ